MKFVRAVRGCSLRGYIRNKHIRKDFMLLSVLGRVNKYRQDWKSLLEHMRNIHILKQLLEYRLVGWKDHRVTENSGQRLCKVGSPSLCIPQAMK